MEYIQQIHYSSQIAPKNRTILRYLTDVNMHSGDTSVVTDFDIFVVTVFDIFVVTVFDIFAVTVFDIFAVTVFDIFVVTDFNIFVVTVFDIFVVTDPDFIYAICANLLYLAFLCCFVLLEAYNRYVEDIPDNNIIDDYNGSTVPTVPTTGQSSHDSSPIALVNFPGAHSSHANWKLSSWKWPSEHA